LRFTIAGLKDSTGVLFFTGTIDGQFHSSDPEYHCSFNSSIVTYGLHKNDARGNPQEVATVIEFAISSSTTSDESTTAYTQAFTSNMAHASLERQLVAAQSSKMELETKLRKKEHTIKQLEHDRRWFADRKKEEKKEGAREDGT
jgi:hypothetical protein